MKRSNCDARRSPVMYHFRDFLCLLRDTSGYPKPAVAGQEIGRSCPSAWRTCLLCFRYSLRSIWTPSGIIMTWFSTLCCSMLSSSVSRKITTKIKKKLYFFSNTLFPSPRRDFPRLTLTTRLPIGFGYFSFVTPQYLSTILEFIRRPRPLPRTPSSRTFGRSTVGVLMVH